MPRRAQLLRTPFGRCACPYANICETCDKYIAALQLRSAHTDQLADVQAIRESPSPAAGLTSFLPGCGVPAAA